MFAYLRKVFVVSQFGQFWWYLEQDRTRGLDISLSTLRAKRLSIVGKRRNRSILHRASFFFLTVFGSIPASCATEAKGLSGFVFSMTRISDTVSASMRFLQRLPIHLQIVSRHQTEFKLHIPQK
jgi:hypothetical protein